MGPLGILGGGQLGRMTLQAASVLGLDVVIAERTTGSPAARMAAREIVFPNGWADPAALETLARAAPLVTLESEFVDAGVLRDLERRGSRVWPAPACVAIVQDKLLQKQALAAAELPVPRFAAVASADELRAQGARLGWPVMLKARRDGYDGRGNLVVHGPHECEAAVARLGSNLLVEELVPFERELAVLVVRGQDGQMVAYPVVETRQDPRLHICRAVLAPAEVAHEVAARATTIARGAAEAVGAVGALGVELFLLADGGVLINELAPRPHNSAHYTIEGCLTSQFANHVRAVFGLPLGEPILRAPAAVMVNLLGTGAAGPTGQTDLAAALAVRDTVVHLYGKTENRPGRKLGHVTALGASVGEALERAQSAADRMCL